MPRHRISMLVCALVLLVVLALASLANPSELFRLAIGDVAPLLLLGLSSFLCLRNALASRGHSRLFWSLITSGMAMWFVNQLAWTWQETIVRRPLPDPFFGDIVLFLHLAPIIGAVAIRPHQASERDGLLISALNASILCVWWVVVYAFFVFPEEYLATNTPLYTLRWDLLYFAEGLMLAGICLSALMSSSGEWRVLYGSILGADLLYCAASSAMNAAIARGVYRTGSIYDIFFIAAVLAFLWVAFRGSQSRSQMQVFDPPPRTPRVFSPLFGQLALLSLPVIGYVALFWSHDSGYLRQVRFAVTMGGVAFLTFLVFLKQYTLDRRLVQLLHESRDSYSTLQKLQSRAVQQAKLTSLGELVALAASELEHPLSVVLDNCARLASSTNLSREQLANAQKIGQQARRTHELVTDLLSFAQQSPGEKVPLDIKSLLQRALQMEGLKLDHRNIVLAIDRMESLPRVLGNSNQLLQAFVQIVENAVDALETVGGGKLLVSAWRDGEDVVIEFADNGPGLQSPERVFDPFYTTKPVGKGTGLGLSATYGVIQDHKGQITCSNRSEGGAAFEVRLPAFGAISVASASAHA
jgi:signal transduction histidine kinase